MAVESSAAKWKLAWAAAAATFCARNVVCRTYMPVWRMMVHGVVLTPTASGTASSTQPHPKENFSFGPRVTTG